MAMILRVNLQRLIDLGVVIIEDDTAIQPRKRTAPSGPRPRTWVAKAVEIWESRMGAGSGSTLYGRVGKAFKPLIEADAEDAVLSVWSTYMNTEEISYLSPEAFARRYAQWKSKFHPPSPLRVSKEDEIRELLLAQERRSS